MLISIVIPAYNEAKRIRETLDRYVKDFYPGQTEIIVVLNGCRDDSREVVERAIKELGPAIRYFDLKTGGKGLAVHYGFQKAEGELVGFLDADGSTSPEEYRKLVEAILQKKYDGAIASRWKKGSQIIGRKSPLRKLTSQGFHLVTKLLFWLPVRDTQCGAKLFRREVVQKILPNLKEKNMAFDVELLWLAKRAGFHITEVPSVWVDKSSSEMLGSTTKLMRTSLNMFLALVKIRFQHLFK
ncbi:MAG: glycosyltransferase family 2 protein [Patescibacteria group bacterium]|nr:glycosyltransferase family 2 protein [Patescibacteria group bacterium]